MATTRRTTTIHYHRADGDYGDPTSENFNDYWGLHVWQGTTLAVTAWEQPLRPTGKDEFGIYFELPLTADATEVGYVLHRGETKDPGPDQFIQVSDDDEIEVWQIADDDTEQHFVLPTLPGRVSTGNLRKQRAHWISQELIAWNIDYDPAMEVVLYHAHHGGLEIREGDIQGGVALTLQHKPNGMGRDLQQQFPHLAHNPVFRLPDLPVTTLDGILRGQIAVALYLNDELLNATGLQIPGVLDALYAYNGPLGPIIEENQVTLRLWAPTAQSVTLHRFTDPTGPAIESVRMQRGSQGTWEVRGERSWLGSYYLYEVHVYVPQTRRIEHNFVTDPYSVGLAMNGTHSLLVDLSDPMLKPDGWESHTKPPLAAPEDIVLYELHLRDFSINDNTMPPWLRGKYGAFTVVESNGMRHLQGLAQAGLTHIHLLPVFDFLSVSEDPQSIRVPAIPTNAAPDADAQAAAIRAVKDQDGFNWGYDPHHYTVPDGAYATNPNGTARILEFRQMVQALHAQGLRVVMDVVYNHTHDGGQEAHSVLDKIVPGYYHRLNAEGGIERSTCCANTASEHAMMEKLMLDSLRTWAEHYGLDGFRFDLMGHHMVRNMVKVRDMLATIDESIYIYGEGWDFGEVMHNGRGKNASQFNLAGTGIGTFNDRIRNAIRGGRPFDNGHALIANQGFANGLWYAHNAENWGNEWERGALLHAADWIRVGLAGNLADYAFEAANGHHTRGWDIDYYGTPCGYNQAPHENVPYVEAHDNQTFYDNNVYKLPLETSMADRVRVQTLGLALTILAQGVPFLHAGSEMLRSKSLERDSYNSGDWFNRLNFDYSNNNFGVGLPVEAGFEADLMRPLLANPHLRADQSAIRQCIANVKALLTIRKSSPLFRLRTKEEVIARLAFHNTGPHQIPGLIVMSLSNQVEGLPSIDPNHNLIVVAFNATTRAQQFQKPDWQGLGLTLHPALRESGDQVMLGAAVDDGEGIITVPPRTVVVLCNTIAPVATAARPRPADDFQSGP